MEIQCGDVYCKIIDGLKNLPAVAIVKSVCRARPSGYQFMPTYRKGQWDGYISLMRCTKFPTGLLSLVLNGLRVHGFKYTLLDNTSPDIKPSSVYDYSLKGITLRDYQLDAINQLVISKRGVAKMATNSGKTEVMAGIIHALNYPKTFVLLHRKELLYQTAERFVTRLGIEVGMVGDGHYYTRNVTVAMIQTLYNNMHDDDDTFKGTQLVMVDECHHSSSDSYMEVLEEISGKYRYGFSGTPLKYDLLSDMKLMAYTGDIVVDIGNQYLIEAGFSAVPKVHIVSLPDMDTYGEVDYQSAYRLYIVDNTDRNKKIAELSIENSKHGVVLILVNRLDHGNIISSMIPGCRFVSGVKTSQERLEVLNKMRSGKGIYCATPIFDEGIDVPAVNTIIMAGGGKSHIKLLQRIGRGLRQKENNVLNVYDFADTIDDYLYKHYEARRAVYAQEGFEIVKI